MTLGIWPGLSPIRQVLPNEAVVTALHTATSPAVTISLLCRAGSVHDPDGAEGVAHLVARALDCGTERLTADALADALDDRGVALNIAVNRHALTLSCSCLSEDFEPLLDLLVDVLGCPSFPDEGVEVRRAEVLTALRQDDDNPALQAERHLRRLLYGASHPYGRPVRGGFESVDRLDSSDLRRFHARYVQPSVTSLVIVGDIEPDAAIAAAERLSSGWRPRTQPATAALTVPAAAHTRQQVIVPMMSKSQTDIAYGFIGLRRHDPLYYAAWVMNTALGQYGLGGRLGDNIREQQGMAYDVFSDLEADVLPGPLVVRAGVNAANVQRTIDAIDLEIRRMMEHGLDDAELSETKRFLVASMPRLLETNAGIASFFQDVELYGLGEEYDRRLPDLVAGVTREGVAEAARVLLDPSRATIVIAGPYRSA